MLQELIEKVIAVLYGAWRYRWYGAALAWAVAVGGWTWVALQPDVFSSSARVYVDTQTLLKPLLHGLAVQTNDDQRIDLMTRTLMSRPTLEKLARMTDLDLEAKTPEQTDELIGGLSKRLRIGAAGRTNLYTISYTDSSPDRAKLVAQSLLTLFVEGNLGDKRKEADSAGRFIEEQIREHEQRLVAAEERVKEFKQKNIAVMGGAGGGYSDRIQAAKQGLEQAGLALRVAENKRDELRRQLEGESPSFGLLGPEGGAPATPYDRRISELRQKLDELLVTYTEQHPDVVALQRSIDRIAAERAEYQPGAVNPMLSYLTEADPVDKNPVYQELKLRLGDAEAEIATKRVLLEDQKKRVEDMQKHLDRTLEVEAEYARLNRDYGLIKGNYDQLVARNESLKLSEKVDTTGDVVTFRVIEPPRVPLVPSGPDRLLYASITFGAAVGLGLALALVLSQLIPVFYDRRALAEGTELLVLGSIDMVWTERQVRKQRFGNFAFTAALLLLFTAYGGLMANYALEVGVI